MCTDGALAWEVKDFLVQQENCESVEIEGKTYTGKGAKEVRHHCNITCHGINFPIRGVCIEGID